MQNHTTGERQHLKLGLSDGKIPVLFTTLAASDLLELTALQLFF